ncbi:MAG: type VI secretion system baseplate subunit TssK [Acidobacteriaceae bacterium]|nr:type VI secretion system baseplate subunit TssK [Acidobacteriaceae bacterium]MBV9764372.1 type VI secretion system baseplate subunit TssK [Acidobacteriaceae bacterium]
MQRLVWRDGTFIVAQHFQASDLYVEDALQFRFLASYHADWGFLELKTHIAGNTISITRASGIFSDGLLFDIPEGAAIHLEREVDSAAFKDIEQIEILLAVPRARLDAANVFVPEGRSPSRPIRYISNTVLIGTDNAEQLEASPDDHHPITFAVPNFLLLLSTEKRDGYSWLPIARVSRPERIVVPDEKFVPPCLTLGAHIALKGSVDELVKHLVSFRESLSREIGTSDRASAASSGYDSYRDLLLLQTLNSQIVDLKHLIALPETTTSGVRQVGCHPAEMFRTLLQFAGSLQAFCSIFSTLPAYDHLSPGAPFKELIQLIRDLLAGARRTNWRLIPLTRDGEFYISDPIPKEDLENGEFLLGIKAFRLPPESNKPAKVGALTSTAAKSKVGTAVRGKPGEPAPNTSVFRMRGAAGPGIPLEHRPNGPGVIAPREDFQYFALSETSDAAPIWKDLVETTQIAIFLEQAEIKDPTLELIVVFTGPIAPQH